MLSPSLFCIAGGLWLFITFNLVTDQVFVVDDESNYFRVKLVHSIFLTGSP